MSERLIKLKQQRDDLDARIAAIEIERGPIKAEMSDLGKRLGNLDRTIDNLNQQLSGVKQEIAALSVAPNVSDHAVVRYLERRYSFSFEDVRAEMLTPTVVEAMKAGCASVKALNGTLKLSGMKIVTFTP